MTDQLLIRSVREFVAGEVAPAAARVDRTGQLPDDLWQKLGEHGLAGLVIPERWGGVGAAQPAALAALEAVAAGCGSTAWALLAHSCAALGIVALGSDAQKDGYLPALAAGRLIGSAVAATETGGGSNPMSIRTTARPEGDGYVLDGDKFFITQAGAADLYLVLARTSEAPGPNAFTCLLVEKGDRGLSFGGREETMGLHGVEIREMVFGGCRLPPDRVLGSAGGGLAALGAVAGFAVLGAAAAAVGLAQAALDAAQAHVQTRTILGQPLVAQPAVQAQLVEARLAMAGARAWLAHALAEPSPGPFPVAAWMAKIAATEAALRVIDRCLALHGATGYSRALPLERLYRDARAYAIHWGNNEVLKDQMGKLLAS